MEQAIREVVNSFCNIHSLNEQIQLEITLVDNLEVLNEYVTGEMTERYVTSFLEQGSIPNGTVIFKNVNEKIYIFILSSVFRYNNATWVGTIHHEMTHANDMYEFCIQNGLDSYERMLENEYYNAFIMWSEYHARKNGFMLVRACSYSFNNQEEEREHIEEELEMIRNKIIEEYRGVFSTWSDLNALMQHLGRIAVFHELFPEDKEYFLDYIFRNALNDYHEAIVRELYNMCYECKDVEKFMQKNEIFKETITKLMESNDIRRN